MDTLPTELLIEIFTRTRGDRSLDIQASDRTPWTLSQVSQRFRSIAVTSPELWTNIHVNPSLCMRLRDPTMLLSTILLRSGSHIRFSWRKPSKHVDTEYYHAISHCMLAILLEFSPKWVSADLDITSDVAPHLRALQGRIPLLRQLSISCYDSGVRVISGFSDAPALEEVTIRGMDQRPHFALSTSKLRVFRDGRISGLLVSEIAKMPALEVVESISLPPAKSDEVVTLDKVRRMAVTDSLFSRPGGTVVVPNLEELGMTINCFSTGVGSCHASVGIAKMIEVSGCRRTLRRLSLFLDERSNDIFRLASSVDELGLRVAGRELNGVLTELFTQMVDTKGEHWLPRLSSLAVTQCDDEPSLFFDEREDGVLSEAFMGMLTERRLQATLEKVAVDVWTTSVSKMRRMSDAQRGRLVQLRKGGLVVSITGNDFSTCRTFF
ncbi:hypothetical protein CYLTODRAFT_23689 [Cylindrobasidium torrendii FP15055 ss-10]|uniref:F-box domain-containing protein n=1 Tax=Cylindrobasidium torrendii FP15055 ss-10 TaxID=1314674 RepID=A0A0D7B989_9AGAR|nr:hypothetical protein CYLTODRAFT_23689 [Cylindrobasidium torrendii FP15055 ss-10]